MVRPPDSLRDGYTDGHGKTQKYNSAWLTPLEWLITGVETGYTGPTVAGLITGAIGLTGQQNPVYDIMHIWIRMRSAVNPALEAPIGSTARIVVWVRPPDGAANDFYYFTTLNVNRPSGQLFSYTVLPPGEYRFGLSEITKGAAVDLGHQVSE